MASYKVDVNPDVLVWAREVDVILALDIKNMFHPAGNMTETVIRLLERTDTQDRAVLLFIDHPELLRTKQAHPELTTRALVSGRLLDYPGYLRSIRADSVSLMYGMFHPQDVEQIHAAGLAVSLGGLWNPAPDLFRVLEIDVFSHGDPAVARKLLETR